MPYQSVERHSQMRPGDVARSLQPCNDKIAMVAYYKWVNAGKPSGRDKEFWLAAEREVLKQCR